MGGRPSIKFELTKASHKGTEGIAQKTVIEGRASIAKNEPMANELHSNDHKFQTDQIVRISHTISHDEGIERHIGTNVEQYRNGEYLPPAFPHTE